MSAARTTSQPSSRPIRSPRDGFERHRVGLRVEGDRGQREGIDVVGRDLCRTGPRGRDRHKARAGGEIEHPRSAHERRMIQEVARQRLAARPGEGPERRRQPDRLEFGLGLLPQRRRFLGQMEADLGRVRHRQEPGVRPDEARRGRTLAALTRPSGRDRRATKLAATASAVKPSRTRARAARPKRCTRGRIGRESREGLGQRCGHLRAAPPTPRCRHARTWRSLACGSSRTARPAAAPSSSERGRPSPPRDGTQHHMMVAPDCRGRRRSGPAR